MNVKGANRGIRTKTFRVVQAAATVTQPFTVRDLCDAATGVERPTVTKSLSRMVTRRWVGPPDGRKRDPHAYKRDFTYRRTNKFPVDINALKVFKPTPKPRVRRLFRPTELDIAWRELKATFERPDATTIDELMPDEVTA